MKNLKYLVLLPLIFCFSCEDVIPVELSEAEALFVVDAWIDNYSDQQTIKLSWSQPYFDSTFVAGITDADVTVTNTANEVYAFDHAGDGIYVNNGNKIDELGMEWNLNIEHNGKNYTASTFQNRVPPIDSIIQEFRVDEVFTDDGIYCTFISRDPKGRGDCYWIKTFKNGMFLNRPQEINIAFDGGLDAGPDYDELIFIQPIKELLNETDENFVPKAWEPGEEIRLEIHSISQDGFSYMETLRDQLINGNNGIFAEPLANTRGNITSSSGEQVLGFFNVSSVSAVTEEIR